ncbi:MAG: sugar ABC transporter permease [Clostridiales bacterium]|jgi:ABC-type sugar transport system permease subunit|nr:sugar ABC transporter permease [Clostridiales bacterium]
MTSKLRLARFRKNSAGYIFVLPVIIGIVFFFAPAMVQSLVYSFHEVSPNPAGGVTMSYLGFANFNRALNVDVAFKYRFITALTNLVADVPVILIFSFIMANALNQKFKGRWLFRAIFFIPVIIGTGIIAKIETDDYLFGAYGIGASASTAANAASSMAGGTLNVQSMIGFLRALGLGRFIDYIITAIDRLYYVVNNSGVQIVIFLSALQGVPQSLYEASRVEGCSGWESFWKITLPLVSPILLVNTIYTIVNFFLDPKSELTAIIQDTTFLRGLYGYGAAMTWLFFASAGAILAVICFLVSRMVFYYDD